MSAQRAYFLGCISGTSVDGLDIALLELSVDGSSRGNDIKFIKSATIDLPPELRGELLALGQPSNGEIDKLGHADTALGKFTADALLSFIHDCDLGPSQILAVGSHGQTVRHRPQSASPFTLQIGDPNQLAELTGITTVADFRRRDMAAGGEGAPLVPLFHDALFADEPAAVVLLNIGGIANLTVLPAQNPTTNPRTNTVRGFDTGPGNGLMDAWIAQHQNVAFDQDGAWAAQGAVEQALLTSLLTDPYFAAPAPKSTGKEYFNLEWLAPRLDTAGVATLKPQDIQATLLELTAQSVANALAAQSGVRSEVQNASKTKLLVCGGGRLNGRLMHRLQALMPSFDVLPTEGVNIDGDSLEAAAFAWLACRTLAGLPGNTPAVTGALGSRVLGGIYPGESFR